MSVTLLITASGSGTQVQGSRPTSQHGNPTAILGFVELTPGEPLGHQILRHS